MHSNYSFGGDGQVEALALAGSSGAGGSEPSLFCPDSAPLSSSDKGPAGAPWTGMQRRRWLGWCCYGVWRGWRGGGDREEKDAVAAGGDKKRRTDERRYGTMLWARGAILLYVILLSDWATWRNQVPEIVPWNRYCILEMKWLWYWLFALPM